MNEFIKCKLCEKEMKAFRLVSHINFIHKEINVEKYIEKFGEFRPKELKKQNKINNKQNSNKQIICKLCNSVEDVNSFRSHLRWKHPQYNSDIYSKEFGEFRPKELENNQRKEESNLFCLECNQKVLSHNQLLHHINKFHIDITQEDYIIKHFYNGVKPKCKCGCKKETKFINNGEGKYFNDYIKGHIDWIKPGWIQHTHETKMLMREIKINQLKEDTNNFFEKISKAEIEIQDFLRQYVEIEISNRNILHGKEIDILIPTLNIGIEFNGTRFHSDLFKDKNYHINKTKECLLKNIRLIHIWESDWIFKKDIIKSQLLNYIGFNQNKIYARKCKIKEISKSEIIKFLKENHLQGYVLDKIRLGLFYNDKLVSVMSFGKLRKNLGQISKEGYFELLRFCNKLNTGVIGGASKLFKYFLKTYQPKNIISYANRDWSQGNVYFKLGFQFLKYTTPGYCYYKSKIRYNRFLFRKDILVKQGFDPLKTESQIMSERGFYKVWNTGNLKFEYNNL